MKWLPINDYEGLYEVSDTGLVRSVDRVLKVNNQKDRLFKGKILSTLENKSSGYLQAKLWKEDKGTWFYVHRLVLTAFTPNPENKPVINHIDGIKANNDLSNLEWVTSSENSYHASRTGLRIYTSKLTEEEFLECLNDVINGESYSDVSERVPYLVPYLSVKVRQVAKKYNLEHLLDESLRIQKAERARTNGSKNTGKTK